MINPRHHAGPFKGLFRAFLFLGLLSASNVRGGEPTFNGRALSEWLAPGDPAAKEEAIRQIGTNGIPTLLDILGVKDGNRRRVLQKLKSTELKDEFNNKDSDLEDLQRLAVEGFGVLGTNAASAVPQLTKLFHDRETRLEAARALIRVGPRGFAVLTNALADKDSSVRNNLIWVIGQERSVDSQLVTQILINALNDTDAVNRGNAATFLGGRDPEVVVPVLVAFLDKERTDFVAVSGAAKGLVSYGPAAKSAAPLLLSIYTNTWDDTAWRVELSGVLKGIDRNTAAEAERLLVNRGPLSPARLFYTRTRLPNGKELIAGGFISTEFPTVTARHLATTELFDPATGTWTETGQMNIARWGHTAILINNVKVMLVGGSTSKELDSTSAELYDVATGTWTQTAPLNHTHRAAQAVLQRDGKVRIPGGWDGAENTDDELYDPAAGTWTVIMKK